MKLISKGLHSGGCLWCGNKNANVYDSEDRYVPSHSNAATGFSLEYPREPEVYVTYVPGLVAFCEPCAEEFEATGRDQ